MATRKKAKKAKAKRTRKSAAKPVARKKIRAVKKTVASKKPVARKKPVAKKRPLAKKKPAVRPVVKKQAKKPAPPAAPPAPAPLVGEERVGIVTHYYGHLSVAAVTIDTLLLRVGDTIHVVGHTSDFRQRVESMQIEHEAVSEALPGQEIGLKVTEHAREHDIVYKVPA